MIDTLPEAILHLIILQCADYDVIDAVKFGLTCRATFTVLVNAPIVWRLLFAITKEQAPKDDARLYEGFVRQKCLACEKRMYRKRLSDTGSHLERAMCEECKLEFLITKDTVCAMKRLR
jgi:hypothetical protein